MIVSDFLFVIFAVFSNSIPEAPLFTILTPFTPVFSISPDIVALPALP